MNDTAKTPSDTPHTAAEGASTSPPKVPTESPPPVGDPEVVANPITAVRRPSVAPAPLKI